MAFESAFMPHLIIGLIATVWAFMHMMDALPVMFTWVSSPDPNYQYSGFLLVVLLIAAVIGVIGTILGLFTKRAGGGWLLSSGISFLTTWLFNYFGSPPYWGADPNIYHFIDAALPGMAPIMLPLEGILYLLAAIFIFAGRQSYGYS